jgi:ParB-like chromosome segregation protein Spo0J
MSKTKTWTIDTITPYEQNAKIHNDKQVEKIAKSIQEFGWVGNPIVVNEAGVILAGHGRRLAALKLGLKDVPIKVIDNLSEAAQRAYRLADNRVALSDIDSAILQKELADLDFDLDGIFDKKELEFMEADLGDFNADAFVDDIEVEVAKQGEESAQKVAEVDSRDVKVDKALGFKTIPGSDERHVAKFMAQIEAEMGATGSEAFVRFIKSVMEDQSRVTA